MAQKTKDELKSYFENGDIPNAQNYIDLIDTLGDLVTNENTESGEPTQIKLWTGTQAQYDEFGTGETSNDTIYFIKD